MNLRQKFLLTYLRIKIKIYRIFSARAAAKLAYQIFCTPLPLPPRKEKEAFLPGNALSFLWKGLKIAGYRVNISGTKKLLLLHGFNSNCNNFEKYVAPALEKGYQVFAFDAPAHGRSEGKRLNALDYSDFVVSLNKNFGPFDAYIAHSFGGLAACLALEHIQHSTDTKLVLIAPATETSSAIYDAFKRLDIRSKKVGLEFEKLSLEISSHPISWFSIRRAVKNINARILWLHDEDDCITPVKDARAVEKDGYPNIRFIFSHSLGHRDIYRDENQIKKVIEFL